MVRHGTGEATMPDVDLTPLVAAIVFIPAAIALLIGGGSDE
jgi:hypothetical protein